MICGQFQYCNIDPVWGLLIVITLFVVLAVLLKGDSMAESFRSAVAALLKVLVNTITRKQGDDENGDQK